MGELINIKHYDEYVNILNEDLIHGEQSALNRAFMNGGPITFADGSSVTPKEIVNAVNNALMWLNSEFSRTFTFAKNTLNIIYLPHSNKIKTMAVDEHMNLYMNVGYIYHKLKMDKELIAAVIMHEVFHALFDHINRGKNWLMAKGKSTTPSTWHDTNLAADVEVNRTLVRIGLIEEERLVKEIKGMYLKKSDGSRDIVPMEVILDDEEYMKKLRSMCPPDSEMDMPGSNKTIETTEEWDNGYKDAWNKVAGLIKKYGHKGAWQKLMDAGIVNAVGEIYTKNNIEDIMAIEFLTVKSYEDYINEDLNVPNSDAGKTYDSGFMTAFKDLMKKLYDSVNPSEGGSMDVPDNGGSGPKYKSGLKNEDLDEIEFPKQKSKDKKKEDDDSLPSNIKQGSDDEGDGNDSGDEMRGGKSAGAGNDGKDDDELTDDDINKLADDINKRTNGGKDKISTQQDIEYRGVGGTGSFQEKGLSDDDLKEAGYSDEDLAEINKVRKSNETNNSKANIQKQMERMKRDLPKGDIIRRTLDAIEIESNKYKNLWKDMLEDFMSKKTRRAGRDLPNGKNDWINKKNIARGEYGIHRKNTSQDPQDVNVYVDVSGSMDLELLEIISKSLVVFTQQWEYSGLNICPWASRSNGVHKVDDFYSKSEGEITKQILEIISKGESQCGGGTDASAVIAAMLDAIEESLGDENKDEKDDVHVVITDGYFDYQGVEDRISRSIMSSIKRNDVAAKAPENTFWMIYDAPESLKDSWKKEIKKGRLIFINSEVVKNNG